MQYDVVQNSYISKTQVCANNTTEMGRVIFGLASKSFSTTVSNNLSRANQIDMTGPNSVVLLEHTLVCSLCNYNLLLLQQKTVLPAPNMLLVKIFHSYC